MRRIKNSAQAQIPVQLLQCKVTALNETIEYKIEIKLIEISTDHIQSELRLISSTKIVTTDLIFFQRLRNGSFASRNVQFIWLTGGYPVTVNLSSLLLKRDDDF